MNATGVRPSIAKTALRIGPLLLLASLVAGAALLAAHGGASAAARTPTAAAAAKQVTAPEAGETGAALAALPSRSTVFELGTIVPTRRPCATHFLVNPKGGERLYALRGLLVNLERYEGRTNYVRGLRLGTGEGGARCGGVPLVLVYEVDTLAR